MINAKRTRDTQRSRVYEWELEAFPALLRKAEFSLEEARAWLEPIWKAERARVGLAGLAMPDIERPHRGQRRALAYTKSHRITLPVWTRSRWMILHEAAHLLTPGDQHGPRFVGELIGLAARHLDLDAAELMARADEFGVKYSLRTIGTVPAHGVSWFVRRAIAQEAMTEIELACHLSLVDGLDLKPAQVRGGALSLIRQGQARWRRGKLQPAKPPLQTA